MAVTDISAIAQSGFAAFMAIVIWKAYDRLTVKLLEIVGKNSVALGVSSTAIEQSHVVITQLLGGVESLESRVASVEKCLNSTTKDGCPVWDGIERRNRGKEGLDEIK